MRRFVRLHISLPEKRETRCIDRVEVHTGISQRAARNAQRPEIKITNKKTAFAGCFFVIISNRQG
nr:MAG TPA: hypothetical protein [Caudoviricetes sp.]